MHRDATAVEAPGAGAGAGAAGLGAAGLEAAELEAAELEMAEVAEVPAWRELWYGSLEALHREPTINNTQEDVLVQLGALAFLHCPVRNLGERGVSTLPPPPRRAEPPAPSNVCVVCRCRGCGAATGTSSAPACSCTPTTNGSR